MRIAPEKSIFLAKNIHLANIEPFCCNNHCWSVLGIDPTFNIFDDNITITTYKHLLLCRTGTNISPVMLGPIHIHSNKSYGSYFTLSTNLVRLNPKISNLKAFGADGEKTLFDAFLTCFSEANHLLCTIHMKGNITKNYNDHGFDLSLYIEKIFGKKRRRNKS